MERYLNVTETRQSLLELVETLESNDRVVITKRGKPRAVLIDFESYALLEDLAWIFRDPVKVSAMRESWERYKRGEPGIRPPKGAPPTVETIRGLIRKGAHRGRAKH